MCFCCSCCCLNAKVTTHGSVAIANLGNSKRMKGVTVNVNKDLCVGCGECLEICKFRGMEMHDGIAEVNQKRCLGCGRCEQICQNNAIKITIDDESRVNELIELLESYVDVAPQ
jgi:ferredoxin